MRRGARGAGLFFASLTREGAIQRDWKSMLRVVFFFSSTIPVGLILAGRRGSSVAVRPEKLMTAACSTSASWVARWMMIRSLDAADATGAASV